jgi:hypothetical protein
VYQTHRRIGRYHPPSFGFEHCSYQAHIPQPWCWDGTGNESGAPVCAYSLYRQCVANAGPCVANPAIEPLPTVPGSTIFMLGQPAHHRWRRG